MGNHWITDELENAGLGDKRLDQRFAEVLTALSERPNLSIPASCGGPQG
ncbi:MAG: IS4/Tn5 family transposase DNA-binding protein [Thermoguttaceae bacterium]